MQILVILQNDYQTTRIPRVIESVQATRPIDQANLFNMFFHSVFVAPDSSSAAIEVLHASRDIIATVTTPPSCMPG